MPRVARRIVAASALCAAVLAPSSAFAWGTAAHRFVMQAAIDLLPVEIKPFFQAHRDELVVRVVDPDTWRVIGWEEDSNHFVDFGVPEFGPYPFAALPRDLDAAIQKFGAATIKRDGMLPWREAEMAGQLRRAIERLGRNDGAATDDVVLFAAVAAHYVQDAHVPLHATNNYDGQLSGQRGIHSRFEAELFERFKSKLILQPAHPDSIASVRDFAFDILLKSNRLVAELLDADKAAVVGKEVYDDEYFNRLFERVRPMLETQISASITATAAVIVQAWVDAGRPALPLGIPRTVQKVRP